LTEGPTRAGDIVAQVHASLREAILSGDIVPGEKPSQAELARRLGVGRTPLREAVRMLQSEGLVLSEPNRRVEIARLSVDDAEELYVMRVALEATAARVTLPQLSAGDLAEMEGLMTQMAHLHEPEQLPLFRERHRAFHERFIAGVGSRSLRLMGELFDHAERYRRIYGAAAPDHFVRREAEHRAMLDAAAEDDGDALAEAIAVHYVRTARLVADALDSTHRLDHLRDTVRAVAPEALVAFD
jgi:DNA-binding GntR family transcriptional regulator